MYTCINSVWHYSRIFIHTYIYCCMYAGASMFVCVRVLEHGVPAIHNKCIFYVAGTYISCWGWFKIQYVLVAGILQRKCAQTFIISRTLRRFIVRHFEGARALYSNAKVPSIYILLNREMGMNTQTYTHSHTYIWTHWHQLCYCRPSAWAFVFRDGTQTRFVYAPWLCSEIRGAIMLECHRR